MESQRITNVVLLSCGSFNPVTNMHLRMFELAKDYLEDTGRYKVVKGIISPVGGGYKKKGLIEAHHRMQMAQLARGGCDWITVDPWESSQPEWMETVKVARHHCDELVAVGQNKELQRRRRSARKENSPQDFPPRHATRQNPRLMLLCGADVLDSFGIPNLWKEKDVAEIVGLHGVVCISRYGADAEKVIHQSDALWRHRKNIHVVHEWVTNEISATHVRRALRRGQSVRYLLPDPVVRYIQENNLYTESEQKTDVLLEPLRRNTDVSSR